MLLNTYPQDQYFFNPLDLRVIALTNQAQSILTDIMCLGNSQHETAKLLVAEYQELTAEIEQLQKKALEINLDALILE